MTSIKKDPDYGWVLKRILSNGLDFFLNDEDSPESYPGTDIVKPWKEYLRARSKIIRTLGYKSEEDLIAELTRPPDVCLCGERLKIRDKKSSICPACEFIYLN